jgi:uncharacterized protein YbcC (UPF0753/DUF2309 family)
MLSTDLTKKKPFKKVAPSARRQIAESDPLASAQRMVVPTWPLQNAVAVNPFWQLRGQHFSQVMEDMAPLVHAGLYMPLPYFLEAYRSGLIKTDALDAVLEEARARLLQVPASVEDLLQLSHVDTNDSHHVLAAAEFLDQRSGTRWRETLVGEIGKYAAAYFDRSQAMVKFPWREQGFWRAWLCAQEYDGAMAEAGIGDMKGILAPFQKLGAQEFIQSIAGRLGFSQSAILSQYFSRLLALNLGWATQFKYVSWQKGLGYSIKSEAEMSDLVAVALAYDYAILQQGMRGDPTLDARWKESLLASISLDHKAVHVFQLSQIWLAAFERSYQMQVACQIVPDKAETVRPRFQLAMCIDVRSEMYRRAIERVAPGIVTIGFAGFFGIPFDYQKVDEEEPGHRLPVLLSPAFKVQESLHPGEVGKVRSWSYLRAFFRNLCKAPHSSFVFVEVFGLYSLVRIIRRFGESLIARPVSKDVPARFACHRGEPDTVATRTEDHKPLQLDDRIQRAAFVLRHMGVKHHARLVVLTGHGSVNANNAFTSSLDCGACGGHPGDINVRFLANLLNDPAVRQGLEKCGTRIPADTWFVPAIHETVTDELYILDDHKVPASHKADLAEFRVQANIAGDLTRQERQWSRSRYLDRVPARRSVNWSEVRPEWGLAGNASFIVAPRSWTRGANLSSRSFLHDYDWRQDEEFKTLELIMTAPMLVTNWINLQYYASTVAPSVYGAGNKVLHNLVNESGVMEGNGGDLRVGLPWQSVHDGERFVHDPLRLSVFIAAPREEIEKIIVQHTVVRELVDNEWLHLLQIDETRNIICRRAPGGLYRPI